MLIVHYIVFAIIATAVNLLFQYVSFMVYDGMGAIYIAMLLGTLSGLIVKYILDKKWIFNYHANTKKDDATKFALYSFMGVFTTTIFWLTELAFDYAFAHEYAKYVGAVVGLSIGYTVKYFLDKKFVFI